MSNTNGDDKKAVEDLLAASGGKKMDQLDHMVMRGLPNLIGTALHRGLTVTSDGDSFEFSLPDGADEEKFTEAMLLIGRRFCVGAILIALHGLDAEIRKALIASKTHRGSVSAMSATFASYFKGTQKEFEELAVAIKKMGEELGE